MERKGKRQAVGQARTRQARASELLRFLTTGNQVLRAIYDALTEQDLANLWESVGSEEDKQAVMNLIGIRRQFVYRSLRWPSGQPSRWQVPESFAGSQMFRAVAARKGLWVLRLTEMGMLPPLDTWVQAIRNNANSLATVVCDMVFQNSQVPTAYLQVLGEVKELTALTFKGDAVLYEEKEWAAVARGHEPPAGWTYTFGFASLRFPNLTVCNLRTDTEWNGYAISDWCSAHRNLRELSLTLIPRWVDIEPIVNNCRRLVSLHLHAASNARDLPAEERLVTLDDVRDRVFGQLVDLTFFRIDEPRTWRKGPAWAEWKLDPAGGTASLAYDVRICAC